jgi:ABC-type phosphate transport system permease subunit
MFKKASMGVNSIIYGFVGIVVLFALLANLFPTLVTYGTAYCTSGAPLSNFFASSSSVGWLIFGAVMLLAIIALIMKFGKGGK